MDYATQYPIRNDQYPRTARTTTIAPTDGRIRQLDAKTQGRKRNSEGQTEIRTDVHASHGFLTCRFLPKLKTESSVQACQKSTKMERDFYKSLSQLAEHYDIEPMLSDQFEYPYNLALALWDMKEKLEQRVLNWEEIRLVREGKKTYFISEEICGTGATLYYIPIEPLYQMLHDPKRKRTAQLLVSVCAYLYQIADIPYFRKENSYLHWMYEMHKEWVEEDDETEERDDYQREFVRAEFIGDKIRQRISNPINLQVFEKRLKTFTGHDRFDQDCWLVACDSFALFTEYPQESIFRNAPINGDPESEGDEYESLDMDKYISFISDTKGWLYENISESINSEFNEYGSIKEPTIFIRFDGKEVTKTDLDLENRLFTLLDDLCGLLYDYKTTRK